MTQIRLELSLADVNTILEALGEKPFQEVYQLIASIQEQAQRQLEQVNDQDEEGTR